MHFVYLMPLFFFVAAFVSARAAGKTSSMQDRYTLVEVAYALNFVGLALLVVVALSRLLP